MIVTDTLANRTVIFCTECGGGRFRRENFAGIAYFEVCTRCKAKGRNASVQRACESVIWAIGGRWRLNREEERTQNAVRAIARGIRRLGR